MSIFSKASEALKTAAETLAKGALSVLQSDTVSDFAQNLLIEGTSAVSSYIDKLIVVDSSDPEAYLQSINQISNIVAEHHRMAANVMEATVTAELLSVESGPNAINDLSKSSNIQLQLIAEESRGYWTNPDLYHRFEDVPSKVEQMGLRSNSSSVIGVQSKLLNVLDDLHCISPGSRVGYGGSVTVGNPRTFKLDPSRIEEDHRLIPITATSNEGDTYYYPNDIVATKDLVVHSPDFVMDFDSTGYVDVYDWEQRGVFSITAELPCSMVLAYRVLGGNWIELADRAMVNTAVYLEHVAVPAENITFSIKGYGAGVTSDFGVTLTSVEISAVPTSMTCPIEQVEYFSNGVYVHDLTSRTTWNQVMGKIQYGRSCDENFSLQAIWAQRMQVNTIFLGEIMRVVNDVFYAKYGYSMRDKWNRRGVNYDKLIQVHSWLYDFGPFAGMSGSEISETIFQFIADITTIADGALLAGTLSNNLIQYNSSGTC